MQKIIQKIKDKKAKNRLKRRPEAPKKDTPYDKAHLSWISPEMIHHKRGKVWKWVVGSIFVATVIGAFLLGAWSFSLALIAFAVSYFLVHLEPPKNLEVKISDLGIKVGDRQYPYSKIQTFWVLYEPGQVKTLNIKVTDRLIKDIVIQLGEQDPAEVREFLLTKIPELEGQTEKISDLFLRLFKI